MTISETTICNMALSKINIAPINSITNPENEPELECSLWYHHTREQILREHTWNFATREFKPYYDERAERYRLPTDFIRMASDHPYSIQENYIFIGCCRCPIINCCCEIKYIYSCRNTNLFDPLFRNLLVSLLASNICTKLTGDRQLTQILFNNYAISLQEAKSIDSQDSRKLVRYTGREHWGYNGPYRGAGYHYRFSYNKYGCAY